jgi:hypothetical protein
VPPPKPANPKRRKQLIYAAAAAGLLLVYLFSRSQAAQATDPSAVDPSAVDTTTGAGMPPSTYADNGGQASQLGDDITTELGYLSTVLGAQGDAFQNLADQLKNPQTPQPNPTPGKHPKPPKRGTYKGHVGSWTYDPKHQTWVFHPARQAGNRPHPSPDRKPHPGRPVPERRRPNRGHPNHK